MLASAQSPESAIKVAKAGIDAMYKSFEFIGPDGSSMKFEEALKQGVNRFHTHTVVGSRRKNADNLKIKVPAVLCILCGMCRCVLQVHAHP